MCRFIENLTLWEGAKAGQKFQLADFQRDIVHRIYEPSHPDGTRKVRTATIWIPRGNGKQLSLDTRIPTPDGWRTMQDIQVGDRVYGEDGQPTTVTYVSPVTTPDECYRITFNDHTSVVACGEHQWAVMRLAIGKRNRPLDVHRCNGCGRPVLLRRMRCPSCQEKRALEQRKRRRRGEPAPSKECMDCGKGIDNKSNLRYCPSCRKERRRERSRNKPYAKQIVRRIMTTNELRRMSDLGTVKLPVRGALRMSDRKLPFDPYLLGLWLGDGSRRATRFSTADRELLKAWTDAGYHVLRKSKYDYSIGGVIHKSGRIKPRHSVHYALRSILGTDDKGRLIKRVPNEYLWAGQKQRLALLQGLLDSDGTIDKMTGCVTFSQKDRGLCEDVLHLIRSLGVKARLRRKVATLSYGDKRSYESWDVACHASRTLPLFQLVRKLQYQPHISTVGSSVFIRSIEPTLSVPSKCIQVDNETGTYLCGDGMNVTHNTAFAAALALAHLLGPGNEAGGQVVMAACDRDNAGLAFDHAWNMCRSDDVLLGKVHPIESRKRIYHQSSRSRLQAISSEAYTKHGMNISFLLCDEIHSWHESQARELWHVLTQSQAKRISPLTICISTVGAGVGGWAHDMWMYSRRVYEGKVDDPTWCSCIYAASPNDDWESEDVWTEANPGVAAGMLSMDELRREAKFASQTPADVAYFKQYHLNIWADSVDVPWIDMAVYDSAQDIREMDKLQGEPCWVGLDLSNVHDLTALVAVFPEQDTHWDGDVVNREYDVLAHFFVPEQSIARKADIDKADYLRWAEMGVVTLIPGNTIDYDVVLEKLFDWATEYDVVEVAIDRWNSSAIYKKLEEHNMNAVLFGQGFFSMSAPVKEIKRSLMAGTFKHGHNPVLRMCFANVAADIDPAENEKFNKKRANGRIDGAVAAAMAVGRVLTSDVEDWSVGVSYV